MKDIINDFFNIISFSNEYNVINKKSFFIHVRLGDYFHDSNILNNVGLLENNYYERAYNNFKNMDYENIYIMSDEIEKVKGILSFLKDDKNIIYIYDEMETIYTMMMCEYGGICSNSTFSWWGAYLNKNFNDSFDKKFIFPNKWINKEIDCDIYFCDSIII